MKTPITKIRAPKKSQSPKPNSSLDVGALEFETWSVFEKSFLVAQAIRLCLPAARRTEWGVANRANGDGSFSILLAAIPVGGSPTGTGESPALPFFKTGSWRFSGVWCLVFGVCSAGFGASLPAAVAVLTLALGIGTNPAGAAGVQNWPRFRGPNGSGVSESLGLPVEFGPGTNLAWRTPVPAGHSSPVVWENRVLVTGYEESRCIVVCFDRKTG